MLRAAKSRSLKHWNELVTDGWLMRLIGYVHTKTIVNANDSKRIFLSPSTRRRSSFTKRFQIYLLWSAFSNLCVNGDCFHRLREDGRPKRIRKFAFTIVCVYNRLRVDGAIDLCRGMLVLKFII